MKKLEITPEMEEELKAMGAGSDESESESRLIRRRPLMLAAAFKARKKDSKLAKKKAIRYEDLTGLPLICSVQAIHTDFPRWCGDKVEKLNIFTTLNLFYNGSVFVREGLGYMLTFDKLADTSSGSELCFRPLEPRLETKMYIIWKKHQQFTPVSELFMEELRAVLAGP